MIYGCSSVVGLKLTTQPLCGIRCLYFSGADTAELQHA